MPILPPFALFVILQWWSAILQLVSAVWYDRQLARYRDHWLVQLHQIADFTPLEQACAGFHADSGRGAPVIHPIPRLVRALLIKYLHNLSLRLTEEFIDNHLLIKWFVGYSLFETPPDHSTLNRFELWVFRHQPRLFFDEVIRLMDHLCPEDRQRIQIVDTFGMEARAAKTYLIELLREMASKILCLLAETDPERHLALLAQLDLLALFGQEGQKITPALNAQERTQRLQQVGQQTLCLYQLLSDSLDQAPHLAPDLQLPLRWLLAYLHKIITDETTVTLSQPDRPETTIVVERQHGDKGAYRVGSASDLTATYRKHDDQKEAILGYNPTVLTTSVFIRETQVDTGAQPDNVALPQVLQSQSDQHSFFPDYVTGDMKYGYGKTRAQVTEVTHGQTRIIAHLPDYDQRSDLFNPRQFTLADDGLSLTCPNRQTTTSRYQTEGKGGFDFRFPAKLCRNCPLWDKCRGPDSKKTAPRNVFISFYRDQVEAARQFNQSETFKQGIKIRMHIERIIYCLTNIYGARQAQSYDQPRVDFQLKMQATAFNLRQLVREVLKKRRPTPAAVRPVAA
jgi:transposase